MKHRILTVLLILLFCSFAFGQKEEIQCPILTVTGPSMTSILMSPEKPQIYYLDIGEEFDKYKLEIKWSIDKGKIISGQGTKSILVEGAVDASSTTTIATVEIKIGEICKLSGSETGIIIDYINELPKLFDEFGKISKKVIKEQFNLFLKELNKEKTSTGYIVNYGTASQIKKREKLILDLMTSRKLASDRLVFVNGGKGKKIRSRLWIIPLGADPSKID